MSSTQKPMTALGKSPWIRRDNTDQERWCIWPPPPPPPSQKEIDVEDSIYWRLRRVATSTRPAFLNTLCDDLYTLGDMRMRRLRIFYYGPPCFYEQHVAIGKRLEALAPAEFRADIRPALDSNALPGGFQLHKYSTEAVTFRLSPWNYVQMDNDWNAPDQLTPMKLREWLEDHCCSDWSKMDLHGESYGGYWRFPEESEGCQNAWEWSRRDSLDALCKLPYPSRAIMWTIDFGCQTRQECVPFTVLCCEWYLRKRAQLGDEALKQMRAFGETDKAEEEEENIRGVSFTLFSMLDSFPPSIGSPKRRLLPHWLPLDWHVACLFFALGMQKTWSFWGPHSSRKIKNSSS